MKTKAILLSITATTLFAISSNAQQSSNRQNKQEPPTVDEIFKQMDKDEDGKLSKKEIKGPLKDDFTKIDTDEDGFLSKEEVENAPKPKGRKSQ
ncbi:MAG: EF-hand domain-containing protein [Maribacter sp.]|uniref:EF-hand domain-containing protein n=1 Tax=Maribacter sp. TaxID=1897614 RepID=UPI003C732F80